MADSSSCPVPTKEDIDNNHFNINNEQNINNKAKLVLRIAPDHHINRDHQQQQMLLDMMDSSSTLSVPMLPSGSGDEDPVYNLEEDETDERYFDEDEDEGYNLESGQEEDDENPIEEIEYLGRGQGAGKSLSTLRAHQPKRLKLAMPGLKKKQSSKDSSSKGSASTTTHSASSSSINSTFSSSATSISATATSRSKGKDLNAKRSSVIKVKTADSRQSLTKSASRLVNSNNRRRSLIGVRSSVTEVVTQDSVTSTPASSTASPRVTNTKKSRQRGSSTKTTQGSSQQKSPSPGQRKPPGNQVPVNTFWNFMEQYFKNLDEVDMRALDDPPGMPIDPTPFLVPPLGKRYEQVWREAYGFVVKDNKNEDEDEPAPITTTPPEFPDLPTRILSMLQASTTGILTKASSSSSSSGTSSTISSLSTPLTSLPCSTPEHIQLNERIARRLIEKGLLNPEVLPIGHHDMPSTSTFQDQLADDELCQELRACQAALRDQMFINHVRKKKLAKYLRTNYLAIQEYYTLLWEIEKQIEQLYLKRIRYQSGGKQHRKQHHHRLNEDSKAADKLEISVPEQQPTPVENTSTLINSLEPIGPFGTELARLLSNRAKLIQAFESIIPPLPDAFLPSNEQQLKLIDPELEKQVLERAQAQGQWLPMHYDYRRIARQLGINVKNAETKLDFDLMLGNIDTLKQGTSRTNGIIKTLVNS